MTLVSIDDVYVRARPDDVLESLTRVSEDASWWPGARTSGGYGWLRADLAASPVERIRFQVSIGPVRPGEGFAWHFDEGPIVGRAEWWLAPFRDGCVVHHLLDGAKAAGTRLPASTLLRRYRWAIRRGMNGLKDARGLKEGGQGAA